MGKKNGFRWGVQWGKFGSGLVMLLIGLAVTSVFLLGGRISVWGVGLIIVGGAMMLMGLIGEAGVW